MLNKNDYFGRQAPNIGSLESGLGRTLSRNCLFLVEYLRVIIVTYCEEYFVILTNRDQR